MHSLASIEIFKNLDRDVVGMIEADCHWSSHYQDEVIVSAGHTDRKDVFFVIDGTIRLAMHSGGSSEITFIDYGPGDFFGELAALDEQSNPVTVVALSDCEIGVLSQQSFQQYVFGHRLASLALARHLAASVRMLMSPDRAVTVPSDAQLIYSELLRLSEPSPFDESVWVIERLPSHRDIANVCGAPEEQVSEAIGQLIRDGLARRKHPSLFLLDRTKVRQLSEVF